MAGATQVMMTYHCWWLMWNVRWIYFWLKLGENVCSEPAVPMYCTLGQRLLLLSLER